FYDTLRSLHRVAALRIYEPPTNRAVGMIEEIVAETDNKLKITYDPVHLESNKEKREMKKRTAEKLVTAALYHALTGEDTGEFAGSVFFARNRASSGRRLHVEPGDGVHAVYLDRTPPPPSRPGDRLRLEAHARIMGILGG
ncbi:MAG: hypothetical protein AAB576_05310, partial [Elusimicrobiota bacterium]